MSGKNSYILLAFVLSAIVQLVLWLRLWLPRQIKDWWPPDSWYIWNILLAGAALLVIAPVLRHGSVWQRIVAGLLGCFPLFIVGAYFHYAWTLLSLK
jgi:hypothetical protein